jgi:hypothetical protein
VFPVTTAFNPDVMTCHLLLELRAECDDHGGQFLSAMSCDLRVYLTGEGDFAVYGVSERSDGKTGRPATTSSRHATFELAEAEARRLMTGRLENQKLGVFEMVKDERYPQAVSAADLMAIQVDTARSGRFG